jgi:hypothetical protein
MMKSVMFAVAVVMVAGMADVLSAQERGPCAEEQRACEMRGQLGERGEGNCRRARACMQDACKRLRRACIFKEERGEQGEGNCRRYREFCKQ